MYRQFNIQQFYVLPTQCIYVFCVDLRKRLFRYTADMLILVRNTKCVFCE